MFGRFNIACLFDREYTDGSGDRRMTERSRRGIHPRVGDGTTAGTFPTWDANRGLVTFDGGDYLVLRTADDVASVLANMGSAQDETYVFYFDPFISTAANARWLSKFVLAGSYVVIRTGATQRFEMDFYNGTNSEVLNSAAGSLTPLSGRNVLFSLVRTTDSQILYADEAVHASGTSTTRDGSNTADCWIGAREAGPAEFLPNGNVLRFFGYGAFAMTPIQIHQLRHGFRSLL